MDSKESKTPKADKPEKDKISKAAWGRFDKAMDKVLGVSEKKGKRIAKK